MFKGINIINSNSLSTTYKKMRSTLFERTCLKYILKDFFLFTINGEKIFQFIMNSIIYKKTQDISHILEKCSWYKIRTGIVCVKYLFHYSLKLKLYK